MSATGNWCNSLARSARTLSGLPHHARLGELARVRGSALSGRRGDEETWQARVASYASKIVLGPTHEMLELVGQIACNGGGGVAAAAAAAAAAIERRRERG
jgi:hypothetical protein